MKEFVEKLIGRLENRIKYNELCHKEFPKANMSFTYEVQINAYKNAIEIVNQVAEEYQSRIMIDRQYCWQTCACTEKCKECNRLTLTSSDIDWYENIEDWTEEYIPRTNADRIRNMSDEELAEFLDDLTDNCCRCAEHQNCGNCQIGLDAKTGFCDIEKWLQSEVKGSDV